MSTHGELSTHKTPTCHKVYPILETLQSDWEDLLDNFDYEPVHPALEAGLENMRKWYRKTDDTSIYFVSHGKIMLFFAFHSEGTHVELPVLNPTCKFTYIEAAWDAVYFDDAIDRLCKIVSSIFLS